MHLVPSNYFTIRCLALHGSIKAIGMLSPGTCPLWLYDATKSLVSICSVFGTYILYTKADRFARIFGSKKIVFAIDFVIHTLPLLYVLLRSSKQNQDFYENKHRTRTYFSCDHGKYIAIHLLWYLMYIKDHDPTMVYFISKKTINSLIALSFVSTVFSWK